MKIMTFVSKIAVCVLFALVLAVSGGAQAGQDWERTDYVRARLLSAPAVQGEVEAVLEMELTKGWHTYWRVPGDAGLPPRFDWSGSENIGEVTVFWPVPHRFDESGFQTFGYKSRAALPLKIKVPDNGLASKIALKLDIMVCKDICIPQTFVLSAAPADLDEEQAHENRAQIELAKRRLPSPEDLPGLKINTIVSGPDGMVLRVFSQGGFESFDVFVTAGDAGLTALPHVTIDENDKRQATVKIPKTQDVAAEFQGGPIHVLVKAGLDAVEKQFTF